MAAETGVQEGTTCANMTMTRLVAIQIMRSCLIAPPKTSLRIDLEFENHEFLERISVHFAHVLRAYASSFVGHSSSRLYSAVDIRPLSV